MKAVITGASRGIGLAIGKKLASAGAEIAILAKTDREHPDLPNTIYSAAAEIEAAGGRALPLKCDVRDRKQVVAAIDQTVATFGGIDVLINNASAISLTSTEATPIARFDLMMSVNARATFLLAQTCLPHLLASIGAGGNPHILTICPQPSLEPRWWSTHVAYTLAKMGMSFVTLGHAAELGRKGIAVNGLWPRTVIQTSALRMIPGVLPEHCRHPEIMADAAAVVLDLDASDADNRGNFFIDEDVLAKSGRTNFDDYSVVPGSTSILPDLFT